MHQSISWYDDNSLVFMRIYFIQMFNAMTSMGGLEQFMGEISEGKKMFNFLVVFEWICSCIWVEVYH